jgi:hypothetical protein
MFRRAHVCPDFLFSGQYLVKMPRVCKYIGCRERPIYGTELGYPMYCSEHKLDEMKNVLARQENNYSASGSAKCLVKLCSEKRGNPSFKGYCATCFLTMYPDDPLSFQSKYKTKEQAVCAFIQSRFDGVVHSAPLYVSRVRIEYYIIISNSILCIITDSNCHIDFEELFNKNGAITRAIVIVFNCNKYVNEHGHSVNPMLYMRLPILEDEIAKQMERIVAKQNQEPVEIIRLFTQ